MGKFDIEKYREAINETYDTIQAIENITTAGYLMSKIEKIVGEVENLADDHDRLHNSNLDKSEMILKLKLESKFNKMELENLKKRNSELDRCNTALITKLTRVIIDIEKLRKEINE